jgi:hypothetical protein
MKLLNNKIAKFSLRAIAVLGLGAWIVGLHGCVPQYVPPPLPHSAWGERYAFSYEPTGEAKAAASVPVTIAVVDPAYKVEDSILAAEPYRKIGKGLSVSMGTDLDKILINKGVTTTGPFPSLDEITYSDKKDAALALAPQVFITMEYRNVGPPRQVGNPYMQGMKNPGDQTPDLWTEQDFVISITGWISFIMQEPLSGEKMWIKKLELDPVTMRGVIATESIPQYVQDGCGGQQISGYSTGGILYDGRPDAIANALKEVYPVVMSQFEKYIDTDELVQLKEKGKEIRASNVFIGK